MRQQIGIEAQPVKDGRNALPSEEFDRGWERRDHEIVAAVISIIRQSRRGVLAHHQPHRWLKPMEPGAVDAVHRLVQKDSRAMIGCLCGKNSAAFVVPVLEERVKETEYPAEGPCRVRRLF